jgi:biotin transport system ATP-binding protein
MVFQQPRDCFVAATVAADVAFGPENLGLDHGTVEERVASSLEAVRMAGRGDERLDALSGGEQARVAIAGALAMAPAHLVLDEPFAGLDWPAREAVLDRLAALNDDGMSVVVVTHDLRDVAALADRLVVLSGGRVALDDAPDAVADRLPEFDVRPVDPAESHRGTGSSRLGAGEDALGRSGEDAPGR